MDGTLTLQGNNSPTDIPRILCKQCDRMFHNERSLRCHIKVHNEKCLKCCFCTQMFNRTDTLFLHALEHISKGTLPCRAHGCDTVVESMLEGEQHVLADHGINGTTLIKCKDCPENLTSFRKMLYHHTFKHGELKQYADEMTAKQKQFLRMKKNQNRKDKKMSLEPNMKAENSIEESEEIQNGTDNAGENEEPEDEDGILEQLHIALAGTSESNAEMIGKVSDVIAELFPPSAGDQWQCFHCLMSFTDAILWMTHLGYHDFNNPFKCTGCDREFENRQTFVLHLTYFAHGAK